MLVQDTLFGPENKVDIAIRRIKAFEPPEGYFLAFSGGKDSVVLKALADMAGVKYTAHYALTTADPPEVVRFIRERHPDVIVHHPERSMWQLIVDRRMPPTRVQRYCCERLKECYGMGSVTLTGVRWAESTNRKNTRNLVDIGTRRRHILHNDDNDEARRSVEMCYRTRKTLVSPIIDWEDEDIWEFIRKYNVPYCTLYDEGVERIGCIGCPMSQNQEEFERWPAYKKLYIHAFDRMIERRKADGLETTKFSTGEECFEWWMTRYKPVDNSGQLTFDDIDAAEEGDDK